jgi:pimeloyl-ACP methyl ester carboxylesterase
MARPGEAEGFAATVAEGSPWRSEIGPALLLTLALFRPVSKARRLGMPVWVGLGERDITVSAKAVERFADRAPQAELHRYDADHFDAFRPHLTPTVVADQVAFLRATVRT